MCLNCMLWLVVSVHSMIYAEHMAVERIEPTPEEYDLEACTKDPVTYILELKIHAQKAVVDAIQAVEGRQSIDGPYDQTVAAGLYFGRIIKDINSRLLPLKVQIHGNMDALVVEEFMTDLTFDLSCETEDPIAERTVAAAKLLREKYNGSIGLHLFVWSCPATPPEAVHIETNEHCGRVLGQLWTGSDSTYGQLYDLIMRAFSKSIDTPITAENEASAVCVYVNRCLARNQTDLGQKVFGTHALVDPFDFDYEPL